MAGATLTNSAKPSLGSTVAGVAVSSSGCSSPSVGSSVGGVGSGTSSSAGGGAGVSTGLSGSSLIGRVLLSGFEELADLRQLQPYRTLIADEKHIHDDHITHPGQDDQSPPSHGRRSAICRSHV